MARAYAIRLAHALWTRLLASAAWSLPATVSVKARSTHSKPSFAACASGSPGHRHNATVTGFHSASLRCNVGTTSQSSRPLTRRLISGVSPYEAMACLSAHSSHSHGADLRVYEHPFGVGCVCRISGVADLFHDHNGGRRPTRRLGKLGWACDAAVGDT